MANGSAAKAVSKPKGESFFVRAWRFIKEAYTETRHRTAWPTLVELRSFTLIVIFALFVVAVWIGTLDAVMTFFTDMIGRSR